MIIAVIAGAYLLGCITFGPLVARAYGVDLRTVGSGNIGATNALRALGKKPAALVLLGDLLKGALGTALGLWFGGGWLHAHGLAAIAAVLGHDFPVFNRFRGGKGVATSIGALMVFCPWAGAAFVLVWGCVFALFRISSLSALIAFAITPGIIYLNAPEQAYVGIVIAGLGLLKHRENVGRLLRGEEGRIRK